MPAINKPNQHFDVKTYSGTGASQTITVGFEPDFAWLKRRDGIGNNIILDKLRLTSSLPNRLFSDTTDAENTSADGQNSFSSTGIVLDGTGGGGGDVNTSGRTYVARQWKAGGAAVTNTSGTISAQVSANPTAGFSVVTYTGTGVTATVGHGLGVAPSMIIVKNRSAVESWRVGHSFMNGGSSPWNYYMNLNGTGAQVLESSVWNNTAPTSSVFTISNDSAVSGSTNSLVAYCFAAVAGYSAFGSYTGNGSADGAFVYTGFRPRLVLIRSTSNSREWFFVDTARNSFNVANSPLRANSTGAEGTDTVLDMVSNGFKLRSSDTAFNASATYIYAAFAEAPFKFANGR